MGFSWQSWGVLLRALLPKGHGASALLHFRAAFLRLPPRPSQLCPARGLSSARPGVRGVLSAAAQGSRIWRTVCPSSHLGSQQKARGHKADLNLYGMKCFRGWVPLPAVLCSLDLWPEFEEGF